MRTTLQSASYPGTVTHKQAGHASGGGQKYIMNFQKVANVLLCVGACVGAFVGLLLYTAVS